MIIRTTSRFAAHEEQPQFLWRVGGQAQHQEDGEHRADPIRLQGQTAPRLEPRERRRQRHLHPDPQK